jgi:hypothetical protein
VVVVRPEPQPSLEGRALEQALEPEPGRAQPQVPLLEREPEQGPA